MITGQICAFVKNSEEIEVFICLTDRDLGVFGTAAKLPLD